MPECLHANCAFEVCISSQPRTILYRYTVELNILWLNMFAIASSTGDSCVVLEWAVKRKTVSCQLTLLIFQWIDIQAAEWSENALCLFYVANIFFKFFAKIVKILWKTVAKFCNECVALHIFAFFSLCCRDSFLSVRLLNSASILSQVTKQSMYIRCWKGPLKLQPAY